MESTTLTSRVEPAAGEAHPSVALVLALLSVPGATVTWDALPGGGFVWGLPLAVGAIVLGVQARRRAGTRRGQALAAILIGTAIVAMTTIWTVVESL
jgi:hypothetical protein